MRSAPGAQAPAQRQRVRGRGLVAAAPRSPGWASTAQAAHPRGAEVRTTAEDGFRACSRLKPCRERRSRALGQAARARAQACSGRASSIALGNGFAQRYQCRRFPGSKRWSEPGDVRPRSLLARPLRGGPLTASCEGFFVGDDVELQSVVPAASAVVTPAVPLVEPTRLRYLGGPEASEVIAAVAHRLFCLAEQGAGYALSPASGVDEYCADVRDAWGVVFALGGFELLPSGGRDEATFSVKHPTRPALRILQPLARLGLSLFGFGRLPARGRRLPISRVASGHQRNDGGVVLGAQVAGGEICWQRHLVCLPGCLDAWQLAHLRALEPVEAILALGLVR
jgi:hypothetical protein